MRQEKEEIALQAVEFWSTVCEVECDIDLENEEEEEVFAQSFSPYYTTDDPI